MKGKWRTHTPVIGTIFLIACLRTPILAAEPPRAWPAHWTEVIAPTVDVAQARGCDLDGLRVLTGGFTETLEATAAIQLQTPQRGWMPIGQAMLRPRAGHSILPLDEERILVIGGWEGVLPNTTVAHHDAEIIEPRYPERRRILEVPLPNLSEKGLTGHSLTQLDDGRIVLVCGTHAVLFNPKDEQWSKPIPLSHPRRHHSACSTDGTSLLIAGGDFPPEYIQPDEDGVFSSTVWEHSGPLVRYASMAPMSSGKAIMIGGESADGTCSESTWIFDTQTAQITLGPPLPLGEGMRNPVVIKTAAGILVASGERQSPDGLRNISHPLIVQPERNRVWYVPTEPDRFVHQAVIPTMDGSIELIGGYRFSAHTGIQLNSTANRIVLHQLAICD